MSALNHPRLAPRHSARPRTWWGKAWNRAVEESAYSGGDLRTGRTLARRGQVGGIGLDAGLLVAAVEHGPDLWTVSARLPVLDHELLQSFVELVAAESGRIAALLAGDLPHQLVEHAEESGVELLPYGGELATDCTCGSWTQPCPHALAVLTQFTWLLDDDPLALVFLRGLSRETLLARLHELSGVGADEGDAPDDPLAEDLDVAHDAALRAARALELLERGEDPGHLI